MTEAELIAVEKLCAAATPGPWICYHPTEFPGDIRFARDGEVQRDDPVRGYLGRLTCSHDPEYSGSAGGAHEAPSDADARLMAAARTALPALCVEARRLRRSLRDLLDFIGTEGIVGKDYSQRRDLLCNRACELLGLRS